MRLFILVLVIFTAFGGSAALGKDDACLAEPVKNGVADLRCWDGHSRISLKGKWDFNYQALNEDVTFHGAASVPLRWREMKPPLPFQGRGVYRIKLLLAEPMDHLALKLPMNYTARKAVIINAVGKEKILFDTGNTTLLQRTIVKMRTPIIPVTDLGQQSELIIYVNSTETINAGLEIAPIIGPADDLMRRDQVLKNSATIISAILIVFFAVNIFLWWVRDADSSLLFLALMTLTVVVRQIAASGVLYEFMPELTMGFDSYIGWGTFLGGSIFGMLFFRTAYPKIVPKWLAVTVYLVMSAGFIILFFQPHPVMQVYGGYINLIAFLAIIVLLVYFIRNLRQSDEELQMIIYSCAALLCGFGADVIYYKIVGFNPAIPLIAVGMMVFVGTQSIIISRRYTQSLRRSAELAKELQASNANLEGKVARRTAELAVKNKELEEMARTDPLTELSNRRSFDELIHHEVGRSQRSGQRFVIGIIDLDRFKTVNDTFGHEAGDKVLQTIAKILRDGLRAGDFPFRWGGDEFCILFPETSGDIALVIAERLKQKIETQIFNINGNEPKITASFGLAVWQADSEVNDIIKQADQAMYESKKLGSNKVTAWWHMSKRSLDSDE